MSVLEFVTFVFCVVFVGGGFAVITLDCLDDTLGLIERIRKDKGEKWNGK